VIYLCTFNGAVPSIVAFLSTELSQPSVDKPFNEWS
jgi:hypothetical protein